MVPRINERVAGIQADGKHILGIQADEIGTDDGRIRLHDGVLSVSLQHAQPVGARPGQRPGAQANFRRVRHPALS